LSGPCACDAHALRVLAAPARDPRKGFAGGWRAAHRALRSSSLHGKEGAMTTPRLSLAALVLAPLALACAHAPAERLSPAGDALGRPTAAAGDAAAPGRVYVTGSRLPQFVDRRTGRPVTTSPVEIYTREDLLRTGVPTDVNAALYRLQPTFR
jgi:hypothetical protein